jgi:hypothetical protein
VKFKTQFEKIRYIKMGKLAEIKTKETDSSVEDFINSVKDDVKRKDSLALLKLMKKATKEKPKLWGSSMIGFGKKVYKSPTSGREVEWFKIGFSPKKTNISLNLVLDIKKYPAEFKKLGKHKAGVGCLYINKLNDVDMKVLEKIIGIAAKKN